MARQIRTVKVFGLGKVGELVATLLGEAGFTVSAFDARPRVDLPFSTEALDVRDGEVRGVTRPLHVGRTTIVVQTELRDASDKLVALVTQTQAVLHPR